jgi:RecA-family ATPase
MSKNDWQIDPFADGRGWTNGHHHTLNGNAKFNGHGAAPEGLESVTWNGRVYTRTNSGLLVDVDGHALVLEQLSPAPEPGEFPWLHDKEPIEALDFANLADDPQIERQWAVPAWFPILETIGFGGPGGEGKTLVAQMFGTAAALGRSCLGLPFEQMRATLVLCEDRHDDAYLRQADINRAFGCRMSDLAGRLNILPRRKNKHNYLAIFDQDGELHANVFFDQLLAELKAFASKFNVIDPRADVFWGNQNDERHARLFVRQITDRIAEETDGLCIMLYQPSRAGRADGSGESGSVQWDAAFRCRLLLNPATEADDPNIRHLVRKKSNFSAKNEEIEILWDKGVFIREEEIAARQPSYEVAAQISQTRTAFVHLLDKFTQQNRPVSSSLNSAHYAPRQFAKEKAAGGIKEAAFERVMRELFDENVIINVSYGSGSKQTKIAKVVAA